MLQGLHVAPLSFLSTSILFADIVDYSIFRSTMTPTKLFDLLTRLFAKFDLLADYHAVQRVDAIDGCYLAATNFSTQQSQDHAFRLARFALDAMSAASATPIDEDRPNLGSVRLQVGLHCGPVCGLMMGAHGGRKYTLVGDAVNVASRMESQGAAGAVQCSETFAAELGAEFGQDFGAGLDLMRRAGVLHVRGWGPMPTYWLSWAAITGGNDPAARAGVSPPAILGYPGPYRVRPVPAGPEGPLSRGPWATSQSRSV